jgi:hypothetical protein
VPLRIPARFLSANAWRTYRPIDDTSCCLFSTKSSGRGL